MERGDDYLSESGLCIEVIQISITAFCRQHYTTRSDADASARSTANESALVKAASVVKKLVDLIQRNAQRGHAHAMADTQNLAHFVPRSDSAKKVRYIEYRSVFPISFPSNGNPNES